MAKRNRLIGVATFVALLGMIGVVIFLILSANHAPASNHARQYNDDEPAAGNNAPTGPLVNNDAPPVNDNAAETSADNAANRPDGAVLDGNNLPDGIEDWLPDGFDPARMGGLGARPNDPVDPDDPINAKTGIKGKLVDSNRDPVAGVTVLARDYSDGGAFMVMGGFGEAMAETSSRPATSGEDGSFVIMGLDPERRYTLVVQDSDDFLGAKKRAPVLVAEEVVDAGTLALDRPASVYGFVVDASGAPVKGAIVRLGDPQEEGVFVMGGEGEDGGVIRGMMVFGGSSETDDDADEGDVGEGSPGASTRMSIPLGPNAARTNEKGEFEIKRVKPNTYRISARAKNHRDVIKDGIVARENEATGPITLRLEAALSLAVTVRDADGFPIPGAEVAVQTGWAFFEDSNTYQPTNASGLAVIEGIQTREVTVAARADGKASVSEKILLNETGETAFEITLHAGASITGRVINGETGEPVQGCSVQLKRYQENPDFSHNDYRWLPPKDQGVFEFAGLKPGAYGITIDHPQLADQELGPFTLEADSPVDLGDIVLQPASKIDVLVLDGAGNPVKGARVELGEFGGSTVTMHVEEEEDDGDGGFSFSTGMPGVNVTDEDGRVTISGVDPGTHDVRARKPGYATGIAENITVGPASAPTPSVTIVLTSGGRVEGRAFRADGSPFGGANVSITRLGDATPLTNATADAQGSFALENVAPGDYTARATQGGGGWWGGYAVGGEGGETFAVEEGGTTTIEVREKPRTSLSGRVFNADGTAAAGVRVQIGHLSPGTHGSWTIEWPSGETTTNPDGSYSFARVSNISGVGLQVTTADGKQHVYRLPFSEPGDHTYDVQLQDSASATGRIAGVVRDVATSQVLGGVTVIATRRDTPEGEPAFRRQMQSQSDGTFAFEELVPGQYRLEFTAPGRALEVRDIAVADTPGGPETSLAIDMHAVGTLLFVVNSPADDGQVVTIEATIDGEPGATRVRRAGFGETVTFENLRMGATYNVRVSAPGHTAYESSYTVQPGDPTPIPLQLGPG